MATAGGGERRSFGVFWDIENCRVPKGGSARELVGRIRKELYNAEYDKEAEFMCVCDASKENKELMKELNSAQVTIIHVDATNKNAADEKLRQRMRYFVETHKPPSTVVLISGDVNFEGLLSDIKHRNQLETILIHPDRINDGLRQSVQRRFPYSQFTDELPCRSSTSKSAEHDCVIHGLPCTRDKKVLSLRLHQLSENCGGKVLTVNPPDAWIRFKDLELAERAGCRMNGEDVFGSKIRVEIAPTPATIYTEQNFNTNNGYQSPRTRKKLRKKRGSKSDYHSSDGSGNSPQSSPQGSPKSSPYHQRPGRGHFGQPFDGPNLRGGSPQRVVLPSKPFSDVQRKFETQTSESPSSVLGIVPRVNSPQLSLFCNGHRKIPPTASSPGRSQQLDDPDPEMESLPWNQKQRKSFDVGASSPQTQSRERHPSYTTNYAYKKPGQRIRTFSDPSLSSCQKTTERGQTNSPRSYYGNSRQFNYASQPNSPFRDPRGRGGFRGGGPGRRFARSRSNSSNRSNQSSPSLSDSGDRFSPGTVTSSDPSFPDGSPPYLGQGEADHTKGRTQNHRGYKFSGDFHLRVTNLDSKKDEKDLKEELKKYFQRHAKVEDICIEHLPDDSVIGIVKVSTLKAAERAAAKLHRTTKIGCKRIHVYLIHQSATTTKFKNNVIELLKEIPDHTLKWFKFVDLFEKRFSGSKMTLTDIQQLSGDVLLLNDEQAGHSVQLLTTAVSKNCSEEVSKPMRWTSNMRTPTQSIPIIAKRQDCSIPQTMSSQCTSINPTLKNTVSYTTAHQISPTPTIVSLPSSPLRTNRKTQVVAKGPGNPTEQVIDENLCALHCPPGSAEVLSQHYLPTVHLHRKVFAAQVHTLLLGHNGSMPLKSFMVCYLAEFPPIPPGEVPIEHLISTIPGVCITAANVSVRYVKWTANRNKVEVPTMSPLMLKLALEVIEVLSTVPRCTLAMSEFPSRYHSVCHKPCCFTDYGHSSLHGLMEAIPHVVRIFGWGSCLEVSLTHTVQLRRFVSDLRLVLRSQPQWAVPTDQLANAFCNVFEKAFKVSDYGACYIEDLIADLPGNVILAFYKDGIQAVKLAEDEIHLELAQSIAGMLNAHSEKDTGLALPRFLSEYHSYNDGVGLQLPDYGVASVRELIKLIPNIVTIERKNGHDMIHLAKECSHHMKVQRARQVFIAYPDAVMAGTDFVERYRSLYRISLELSELHVVLHGLAEVTQDETEVGKITIRMLSADAIARNLCAILEIRGLTMPLDQLLVEYTETYGSLPLVLSVGFSSVQDFVMSRSDLVLFNGPDSTQSVSLVFTTQSDICGNVGGTSKSVSSPELENAAHHLKTKYATSIPKANNSTAKQPAVAGKGQEGLYDSDVAMNNCKPETLMLLKKRCDTVGPGLLVVRNKLAQSVVEDCVSVPLSQSKPECGSKPPSSLGVTAKHMHPPQASVVAKSSNSSPASDPSVNPAADCYSIGDHGCPPVASSRPGSRTASNSSGSPLGSPLTYPGTPRRKRMAAKFSNASLPASPPLKSDSEV